MYHLVHSALPFILSCPELFVGQQKFKCYFLGDVGQSQSLWRKKSFRKSVWHGTCLPFFTACSCGFEKKLDPKNEGVLVHLILHALYSLIG